MEDLRHMLAKASLAASHRMLRGSIWLAGVFKIGRGAEA